MTVEDHDWEKNSGLYPSKRIALANEKDKQDSSMPTMRDNISNGVVNTTTPNLNTTQGVSGTAVEFLIGQQEQQSIRAKASRKRKAGTTMRQGFEKIKNLKASGQMIALTGTYEIGINTLDEVNRRAAINASIKQEEERIKQETHSKHLTNLSNLRMQKPDENTWTKPEILVALRAAKKQGDRANPKHRGELMIFWNELCSRVPANEVQHDSESINREAYQSVLTNENTIEQVRVETLEGSLDKKVGVNEKASMAM